MYIYIYIYIYIYKYIHRRVGHVWGVGINNSKGKGKEKTMLSRLWRGYGICGLKYSTKSGSSGGQPGIFLKIALKYAQMFGLELHKDRGLAQFFLMFTSNFCSRN